MNSKTANSSNLLLKIPVNLNVPVKTLHLYAAYLWFKSLDRSGIISEIPSKYRNRANYWSKKLISCGFMSKDARGLVLKPYQAVWRQMGIKRIKTNSGHYKIKYWKLEVSSEKSFLKDVKDGVFKHLTKRKKEQIAYRLASGNPSRKRTFRKKGTCVELSGETARKLFGYASWSSGLKYRDKYFEVTKGLLYSFLDHNGSLTYRYDCGKVSLK